MLLYLDSYCAGYFPVDAGTWSSVWSAGIRGQRDHGQRGMEAQADGVPSSQSWRAAHPVLEPVYTTGSPLPPAPLPESRSRQVLRSLIAGGGGWEGVPGHGPSWPSPEPKAHPKGPACNLALTCSHFPFSVDQHLQRTPHPRSHPCQPHPLPFPRDLLLGWSCLAEARHMAI